MKAIRMSRLATCFLVVTSLAYAAERDPALLMGGGQFPVSDSIDYQFHDTPEYSNGSPIVTDQRENGQFIVSKNAQETWSVRERFDHFNLSNAVIIPQTNLSIPTSLWALEGGVGYGRHLENGRSIGASFSAGSDSDRLFYTIHETVFQANVSYRVPSDEHDGWLFFLAYSNNRHFLNNVPLPGFGYYFDLPDKHVKGIVGFPFASIFYTPTERWSATASLFGPRRLSAEIAYLIKRPLKLYGGFDWGQQEWERANREDNSDRLFYDKKRVMLGVRTPLPWGLSIDLSGGREFDRRFFENSSSSISGVPYASLPAAWYLETQITLRFGAAMPIR